jgi:hypothetical protein
LSLLPTRRTDRYRIAATVPANSTVWIDAFDSASSQSSTLIFQVNYTISAQPDSTWCMSQYPEAVAASPGVRVDLQQAAIITSSAMAPTTTSTTTFSRLSYTLAPARNGTGSSSGATQTLAEKEYGDRSGVIAGLSISVGVLSIAFLLLLFFHIRLIRRVKRSEKGQATIGKWSKRHFDDDAQELDDAEKPWESFTITKPQPTSSLSSRKERIPHTLSGASLFSTQSGTSRMSSFFENRSASRTGQNNNNEQHDMRQSSSSTANPFEDYSETASTSSHHTTRTTTTMGENALSASISKRYSTAETAISESNTIQSGSGRSHLSATPSEQASTVGGASAVSDEYYHRKKATTISPTGTSGSAMRKFLTPGRNGA